jgi:hypothetical protein
MVISGCEIYRVIDNVAYRFIDYVHDNKCRKLQLSTTPLHVHNSLLWTTTFKLCTKEHPMSVLYYIL